MNPLGNPNTSVVATGSEAQNFNASFITSANAVGSCSS